MNVIAVQFMTGAALGAALGFRARATRLGRTAASEHCRREEAPLVRVRPFPPLFFCLPVAALTRNTL